VAALLFLSHDDVESMKMMKMMKTVRLRLLQLLCADDVWDGAIYIVGNGDEMSSPGQAGYIWTIGGEGR